MTNNNQEKLIRFQKAVEALTGAQLRLTGRVCGTIYGLDDKGMVHVIPTRGFTTFSGEKEAAFGYISAMFSAYRVQLYTSVTSAMGAIVGEVTLRGTPTQLKEQVEQKVKEIMSRPPPALTSENERRMVVIATMDGKTMVVRNFIVTQRKLVDPFMLPNVHDLLGIAAKLLHWGDPAWEAIQPLAKAVVDAEPPTRAFPGYKVVPAAEFYEGQKDYSGN